MNKRKQFFIIFFKIKVFLNDGAKQSNDNVGRDANVARLRRSVDALVGVGDVQKEILLVVLLKIS